MPKKPLSPKSYSLALQGGGAHGAFSWGALDTLLEHEDIEIEAISASGGGSILAAVIAQGLMEGGHQGARDNLLNFWHKVKLTTKMLPLRMNVVDSLLGTVGIDLSPSSIALDTITKFFSPNQFNLFDINPLKAIVEEVVDFEALQKHSPVKLFINATHAKTGKGRLFSEKNLSLDAVMASACLPYLFKTVEVDGEPYWDGSYSACPALTPLVNDCTARDIIIIQIHPDEIDDVPTGAADILDRTTEMSFNAILNQERKLVGFYNQMIEHGGLNEQTVTLHTIEADNVLGSLGRASKLKADWDFLMYLHDVGTQAAQDWLNR